MRCGACCWFIEGAAVTAVKMEGVLHEFRCSIPGGRSATDIILKLAHVGLVRRRRRGEAGRRGDVPHLPARLVDEIVVVDTDDDLRRDQGRVRGHALASSSRPGALAVAGVKAYVERAADARTRTLRRDRLRRQHELRPAALRRRARRAGRAARGDPRRDDPRAAAAASGASARCSATRNVTEFNYRYRRRRARRTSSSASRSPTAARRERSLARTSRRTASRPST